MKNPTPLTADQLHAELSELFMGLKSGSVKPVVAVEMNNAAGKIINLAKLRLEYQRMRGSLGDKAATIPMLEG